tara:strand:- start:6406 stop:7326 length:921 start_codon:yes stop_codon:yes gene_type:complete
VSPTTTTPALSIIEETSDTLFLPPVLSAAATYVTAFRDQLAGMVSEEFYKQHVRTPAMPTGRSIFGGANTNPLFDEEHVELRSDFLLVRPEGADRFVEYRDVFEVNGAPVRDRLDRLSNLFLNPSPSVSKQIDAITEESARYNIGSVLRTLNTPTLALVLLYPDSQPNITFVRAPNTIPPLGLEIKDDPAIQNMSVIAFTEGTTTTLITGQGNTPLPAHGRFWIDTITGAIIASELSVTSPEVNALIAVRYAMDESVGLRVPVEMRERYDGLNYGLRIEGTATYSRFRVFQVQVDEAVDNNDEPND